MSNELQRALETLLAGGQMLGNPLCPKCASHHPVNFACNIYPATAVWWCDVTGNPVGTDTLPVTKDCMCQGCRAARYIKLMQEALEDGLKYRYGLQATGFGQSAEQYTAAKMDTEHYGKLFENKARRLLGHE